MAPIGLSAPGYGRLLQVDDKILGWPKLRALACEFPLILLA